MASSSSSASSSVSFEDAYKQTQSALYDAAASNFVLCAKMMGECLPAEVEQRDRQALLSLQTFCSFRRLADAIQELQKCRAHMYELSQSAAQTAGADTDAEAGAAAAAAMV